MDKSKTFKIEDDKLYCYTPMPQYGERTYLHSLVMTKEAFIKCYEEWIKQRKKGVWQYLNDKEVYECSCCGRTVSLDKSESLLDKYPYCHCGATMSVQA